MTTHVTGAAKVAYGLVKPYVESGYAKACNIAKTIFSGGKAVAAWPFSTAKSLYGRVKDGTKATIAAFLAIPSMTSALLCNHVSSEF